LEIAFGTAKRLETAFSIAKLAVFVRHGGDEAGPARCGVGWGQG
jgi:hypothetical protein